MPNIFWNIRRREERRRRDLPSLRAEYVSDGRKAARELTSDENVLAVWLPGPFEMPRVATGSDLHMAVLTRRGEHAHYRHVLPGMNETGRRLEIAFFPVKSFEEIIVRGFAAWPQVYDAHTLGDVEVLFEREGIMNRMRERAKTLAPSRLFVGRETAELASRLADAERSAEGPGPEESVLRSRRLLFAVLQLFLVTKGVTFSKVGELLPGFKSRAPLVKVDEFELAQGVNGLSLGGARRIVDETRALVTGIFERMTG